VLEEEQRKLNANIDSLNSEIQEYKDKVRLLEAQDQGLTDAREKLLEVNQRLYQERNENHVHYYLLLLYYDLSRYVKL